MVLSSQRWIVPVVLLVGAGETVVVEGVGKEARAGGVALSVEIGLLCLLLPLTFSSSVIYL
jgi:hypothetical protein